MHGVVRAYVDLGARSDLAKTKLSDQSSRYA